MSDYGFEVISAEDATISDMLKRRIQACYTIHSSTCEEWEHGKPAEVWRDEFGILCIAYEDGRWWHYGFKPTGLEWW